MSRVEKILNGIASSGRVAGAYLFLGTPIAKTKAAAVNLAGLLACAKQDQIFIAPDGATLKIDQIRELKDWVKFGPSAGKHLIVVVEGVDNLTDQAAAAFLKTLEEPAEGVVFVLLAEREDKILPTIQSRCQKIIFPDELASWQPKADFENYYQILRQKSVIKLLKFSSDLAKEKERLEEILYDLSYYAREHKMIRQARIILDSLRYIKRRANLKLVLDAMCLKLGGENLV